MRKLLLLVALLVVGVFALVACVPYPDPRLGPWGPKEFKALEYFVFVLGGLLFAALVIALGVLAVGRLLGRGRQGWPGTASALPWPPRKEDLLVKRLMALRQQAGALSGEKAQRVMALVVEACEAWGQREVERAEALAARAEALVELLREDAREDA
ncbi:MAG: hypothetical protein ACP5JV_09495 [Thermus sp.]|uniref:hypothetical protein n=1 Tax=Thermus sp. TaxID=275 RepID=UPI003D0DE0B7